MSHAYHEGLPGYVADAVLHTGCLECEYRARDLDSALDAFDRERTESLWRRAATAYASGYRLPGESEREGAIQILLDPLEVDLIRTVQAVQRTLRREKDAFDPQGKDYAILPVWVAQTRPPAEAETS